MSDLQSQTISNPGILIPVNPAIEDYMRGLLDHTDLPVLIEMEILAQKNNFPIVGRLVGVFLETMAKMINAQRVFEFGSGYGYSAYWFAKKEYRKRNDSGAVYDDPRVAVGAGRFDEVGARAEA